MNKLFSKIWILALICTNSYAQNWTVTNYKVNFEIKMMGIGVKGNFTELTVETKSSDDVLQSITATVATKTINTDNNLRDKHLKEKPEFFEVDKFPQIMLKSTAINKISDKKYEGVFILKIKNISKQIKIPIQADITPKSGTIRSSFSINRNDWKMGGNTLGMADKVLIVLEMNLKK